MKILWVEDFGGKLSRSAIAIEIFSQFLHQVDLARVYDLGNR
jgi:hypothetical protein